MLRTLALAPSMLLLVTHTTAGPEENLYKKIARISNHLGVQILLNSAGPDSWNSVLYEEETNEPALVRYLDILEREYSKYPKGYLNKARAKTLILTRNLTFNGQARAAVPDPYKNQLFLSVNGAYGIASERYLAHVMHHELHHCTEYSIWKSMTYDWPDWMLLNDKGFCYGQGGATAYPDCINKGTDYYTPSNPQKGFINRYSLTGDEEDRAELLAFIMTDTERPTIAGFYKKDEVLQRKTALLITLLNEFTGQAICFPDIRMD